ncbi:MAG: glucosylceramidase [Bacteroidales bacterium]|jgi:glucosylceramidase|nr:glucosylceramidase [Bacteroidales bacterium]MDN5329058.1 glucosylceramidase [Bacteroidales bacterium]
MKFFRYSLFLVLVTSVLYSCQSDDTKKNTAAAPISIKDKKYEVYTTARDTSLRLTLSVSGVFDSARQPLETEIAVFINPDKKYQEMIGIGGAITDAAAETFARLSPENQQKMLEAYFHPDKGIGYNFIRTNIHSCDFSSESYTYIEEGDSALATFSIAHDMKYRIPLIKKAMEMSGNKALLFASPWSPPAFMKDNNSMLKGGKLLPKYYQSWANYFVKFIQEYEKEGVPVWGVTIQNEPMARQTWESCIFTAEEERDFLKYYLGPTFWKNGLKEKKIIVWDHNRDLMPYRADVIFSDPEASKYAWGIGFHWYEDWSGGKPMFDNVRNVHDNYPDKYIIFTEGTVESFVPDHFDYWPNGEEYAVSMIHDFNNGTSAWTDWNILLDEKGGPNHVGNFCFAPMHGDTRTGELFITPAYYYIGHFSKFIQRGAQRLSTSPSRSALLATSFANPDGSNVTVVLNTQDQPVEYFLICGDGMARLQIPAHAIQTIKY